MAFKDIVIPVFLVPEDEAALRAAELVGDLADAHLTAVYVGVEPDPVIAEGYVDGQIWQDIAERLAEDARAANEALQKRPWSRRIAMREVRTRPSFLGDDLAAIARCADLVVMTRPQGKWSDSARAEVFEAILFGAGRPVLLVPSDWREPIGRTVMIAWSGKRESARAVADAMPLIEAADKVVIATVGEREERSYASAESLAANLVRHSIHAERRLVSAASGEEADALLAAARSASADLIVMGGYGHARAAEFVFGGVTRALSRSSPLPLLLAH